MQPDSLRGKAAAKEALMLHHKMTTRCGEGDVTEEKCKLWCCVYGGAAAVILLFGVVRSPSVREKERIQGRFGLSMSISS